MPVEQIKFTPGVVRTVRITSPTRVRGQHFDDGAVIDLPEQFAHELVMASKAKFTTRESFKK